MARGSLRFSKDALVSNYRILSKKTPDLKLIPMIKADAYGHGATFAATALAKEKNLYGFGVATFKEAIELRLHLKSNSIPILVFSDSSPWSENHLRLCKTYALEPVLSDLMSLLTFQSHRGASEISAHIEINTGMNRLGIPVDSLSLIHFTPKSVFTHLAEAEDPKSKLTKLQIKNFSEVVDFVRAKFPKSLLHFSNSAAIWRAKDYPLSKSMNLARPGLSLYGIRPYATAKEDGLKRVMQFVAPVIQRIYLNSGDRVGYNGIYTCKKRGGEWVSVLGVGYADGVFRSLSDKGFGFFGSKKLQFRGRVSMDLLAIEGSESIQLGDEIELFGPRVDPYMLANLAGTNPYELVTRIGQRLERDYDFK